MRRHGIRAIMARPRRVRTTDSRHDLPIAPDLLDRNFIATARNQIWLADITYIETEMPRWRASSTPSRPSSSIIARTNPVPRLSAISLPFEGFYNRTRLHPAIEYISPIQMELKAA